MNNMSKLDDCCKCGEKCFDIYPYYSYALEDYVCSDCVNSVRLMEMTDRKNILIKKLREYDIEFRRDNKLCMKFINNELTWIVEDIVLSLCKIRFLFEYCDINLLEPVEKEDLLSGCSYMCIYEDILLRGEKYPEEWPWIFEKYMIINREKYGYCLDELRCLPPKNGFGGGEKYLEALERFNSNI